MADILSVILEINPHLLFNLIFIVCLIVISIIDIKYMLIYNRYIAIILLMSIGVNLIYGEYYSVLWGIACGLILLVFSLAYSGGMGGGDIKLAVAIGTWLGDERSLIAMTLSFFSGGIAAVIILLLKGGQALKYHIPFAPFMTIGSISSLLWGRDILSWYQLTM